MSEGLAQGPYVAARVGFEPTTFRTQDIELTTEPPRLSMSSIFPHYHQHQHITMHREGYAKTIPDTSVRLTISSVRKTETHRPMHSVKASLKRMFSMQSIGVKSSAMVNLETKTTTRTG